MHYNSTAIQVSKKLRPGQEEFLVVELLHGLTSFQQRKEGILHSFEIAGPNPRLYSLPSLSMYAPAAGSTSSSVCIPCAAGSYSDAAGVHAKYVSL